MTIPTIGFISLGCPKNLVDSERILTQLRSDGYDVVSSYEDAQLVIVNTCGFIDSAVEESLSTIQEALAENGQVIVTGCLGADESKIREVHPNVLAVTGPHSYEEVVNHVHQHLPKPAYNPFLSLVPDQGIKLTPRHYAYLKISEGCDHKCTFCIIPSMRGRLVSRSIGDVLQEAERLKNAGVKELLIVSQDTSAYGTDQKHKLDFNQGAPLKTDLVTLCQELGKLGLWVRLHYVYPYPNVEHLIPLMQQGLLLPYLDMPLQHANPRILKLMKRPGNISKTLERVLRWREQCPELIIRSTFIVGFPGETEQEFQELLDFLEHAELDRVGCFMYSDVEGAAANALPDPVPEAVKRERFERFMATQASISARRLAQKVGLEFHIVIDETTPEGAIGRSYIDAPEIDGKVYLADAHDLNVGERYWATIIHADEHDLHAVLSEDQDDA